MTIFINNRLLSLIRWMAQSFTVLLSKMEMIIFNNIQFYKIKDFSDYYISKCGKVISNKFNRLKILNTSLDKKGYEYCYLYLNFKKHTFKLHRLIAKQFIPNPDNKPQINHKDGVKHNNMVENLEWCTQSENMRHRIDVLGQKSSMLGRKGHMRNKFGKLHPNSKKVRQLDLNNNLIKIWDCSADVQRELSINFRNISLCCYNKRNTAGGFKWEYV